MGLFTKKVCSICGKESRLLNTKLADGNYICSKCSYDTHYHHDSLQGVYDKPKYINKKTTLEEVKSFLEVRQQNLEELKSFNWTKTLCNNIQLDEDSKRVMFVDYLTTTNKDKLLSKNPPVFKIENLAFMDLTFSENETSQTITGKASVESKAYLILGFEDPMFDVFKIEIGKIKAKGGLFFDKVKESPSIRAVIDTFNSMRDAVVSEAERRNILIPANSTDSFWKMLSRANCMGYVSSKKVKEYLKQYCGKDRNMICEIKNTYNLK